MENEFDENGCGIETVVRDPIGVTVMDLLDTYQIDLDLEETIHERD
ncbi:DUF5713 family protein [Listeria ilorinensis]